MRNNPDDLSNQVIAKIKKWLRSEVKENNSDRDWETYVL